MNGKKQVRANKLAKEKELREKGEQLKEANVKIRQQAKALKISEDKNLENEVKIIKIEKEKDDLKEKKVEEELWIRTVYKQMPKTGRELFKDSILSSRGERPKEHFWKLEIYLE